MNIAVMGAGSWGAALADLLGRKGLSVRLWMRRAEQARELAERRTNEAYLPGVALSDNIQPTTALDEALRDAAFVLLAVPAQAMRAFLTDLAPHLPAMGQQRPILVCASKGVEAERGCVMHQAAQEVLGTDHVFAMLSGPSFAMEVAKGAPTAVALGCADAEAARMLQETFATPTFRVYTNPDIMGVELGGAMKNVMAIAVGLSDGLGFGENARAALITRGLAEMSRLGAALGGQARTLTGLAGLGDLVLTCTGDLSRNRTVGLRLGRGERLDDILDSLGHVAEGVMTTRAMRALAQRHGVELPITAAVFGILHENRPPREVVVELMTRPLKEE